VAGFERTGGGIAVYPSRKKLLKHVAWDAFSVTTPLIFAFLLAYLYGAFVGGPDWGVWIFLPFFFLWALANVRRTLYGVYRLVRWRPSLVIGDEGFTDQASASGAGRIRWDQVEESGTFGYGGERYLGVVAGPGARNAGTRSRDR
jgi:hypothetical protein